jgi:hypothetical protein
MLSIVLLVGALFAWTTVYNDFARFYNFEGTLWKISDCVVPNPVTTPCFYGAFAFLIAFIWSLRLLRTTDDARRRRSLKNLGWLLLASVLFALGNFTYVLVRFYSSEGDNRGCSGVATSSPFLTPCFVGSVIFLVAFFTQLLLVRKERPLPPAQAIER